MWLQKAQSRLRNQPKRVAIILKGVENLKPFDYIPLTTWNNLNLTILNENISTTTLQKKTISLQAIFALNNQPPLLISVPIMKKILITIFLPSTVVAFNPLMRSTTNILIINLAISDLMFVIMCIPFTASDYILTNW